MKLDSRLIWVVELEPDPYSDEDRGSGIPVCGFPEKADALKYAADLNVQLTQLAFCGLKAIQKLHPTRFVTRSDLFINQRLYQVATLPLMIPTTVETAPDEMRTTLLVLKDSALEANDTQLLKALPQPELDLKGWSTTTAGRPGSPLIEHYFDADEAVATKYASNNANITSLCGQHWQAAAKHDGPRQHCKLCTRRLNKSVVTMPHRLRPHDR